MKKKDWDRASEEKKIGTELVKKKKKDSKLKYI